MKKSIRFIAVAFSFLVLSVVANAADPKSTFGSKSQIGTSPMPFPDCDPCCATCAYDPRCSQ